jgi:predicted HTH domain antitoxin
MQIIIDIPNHLPDAAHQAPDEFVREAKLAMAIKLYELKRVSSGMAAGIAGVDRVTFLALLHRYGVAVIDLDEDELSSDIANA